MVKATAELRPKPGRSALAIHDPVHVAPTGRPLFNIPVLLNDIHALAFHISRALLSVLKISSPVAGFVMPSLWLVFIRGSNTPPLVDCTSSFADASGAAVPMPTFCAWEEKLMIQVRKGRTFFILVL